ncbi:MAG: hypothetical protein ACO20H_05320 [Bacteriovoracaceae bacterium]
MSNLKVSCLKCIHYHSTHDPITPRGCKVFNFKTKQFPSDLVKKETGEDCHYYEQRKVKSKGFDFHDPKNW